MDFKTATDRLLRSITHDELARRLGCSVATVRQARLSPEAKAHRNPPAGWREVVDQMADEMEAHFRALRDDLAAP